jgi:diguanylate cyclase (GGDEF)-like protein
MSSAAKTWIAAREVGFTPASERVLSDRPHSATSEAFDGMDLPETVSRTRMISRLESLAVELGFLLVAIFALSFWLTGKGDAAREGVTLGALVLAGAASARASSRVSRRMRKIWLAVPAFCVLLLAGEGGRLIAGELGASSGQQWLVNGSFELAAGALLMAVSLYALSPSSLISWSLGLLDLAMIGLAASVPWLELFVFARIDQHGGSILLPQLVSPILAVVVMAAVSVAFLAVTNRPALSDSFLLALGAWIVADVLIAYHLLAGGDLAPAQGVWLGRALLISVAAVSLRDSASARRRFPLSNSTRRLVVLVTAAAISLAYAGLAFEKGEQLVGFAVTIAVSGLLALRLLVHARERYQHSARLERALREQEQLAVMDALTGLYNRRFLDAELKLELDRSARTQMPVGILLCDLDHFKEINDHYGHLIGDTVLRESARRLLGGVRNGDLVARYGGEEFVVLLPGGDKEQLREIGERCRRAFEERPFRLSDGRSVNVTISIGGACWPEDASTLAALIAAADTALYRAKEEGRNRIHVSTIGTRSSSAAARATVPGSIPSLRPISEPEDAHTRQSRERTMERWAELVARALGLDERAQRRCAMAIRYRDIGKSTLPESILVKRGPLSAVEWELVHEHPAKGAALVELAPELEGIGKIIREHHERFDGRGYPCGKRESEISTEARIVACCDAWKAMRRDRPYAPAKSVGEARAELLAGRGTQFDPDVVMAFLMFDEGDVENAERVLDAVPEGVPGRGP